MNTYQVPVFTISMMKHHNLTGKIQWWQEKEVLGENWSLASCIRNICHINVYSCNNDLYLIHHNVWIFQVFNSYEECQQ